VGFIGVYDPETNTDEYDCMINPLLVGLARGDDAASIEGYLRQEITGHFDMSAVSLAYVRPDAFAARRVAWWNEASQTSNEGS
jgi:hypothetical protein